MTLFYVLLGIISFFAMFFLGLVVGFMLCDYQRQKERLARLDLERQFDE
jgi:uncharacterized membrane protein SpoIIM required for sporulation